MDNYCWVTGTYTKKYEAGVDEAFGQSGHTKHWDCDPRKGEDCWHHDYYQWVGLVFVCQAICFYFPKYLWDLWEGGKIKALVEGIDSNSLIRGLETREELKNNKAITEVINHWKNTQGTNTAWACKIKKILKYSTSQICIFTFVGKFYFTEVLYLVNVFVQYLFLDHFLDGHFVDVAMGGWQAEHISILPVTATCYYKA